MKQVLINLFLLIIAVLALLKACSIGLEKEEHRLEVVREHNCKYYGDAINKHYGKELCDE